MAQNVTVRITVDGYPEGHIEIEEESVPSGTTAATIDGLVQSVVARTKAAIGAEPRTGENVTIDALLDLPKTVGPS